MQHQTRRLLAVLGLGSVIAATAAASASTPARTSTARDLRACTITVDKDLVVQPTATELGVRTTDSLPGTVKAEFAPGSKITVDSLARDMGSSTSFKVTANTSQAVAGKWQLTLTSGTTSCTGDVTVTSGQ